MAIAVTPQSRQAPGQFNGGEILEKRPVVATRSYPHLKPYSNLFYWARAWSEKGSTIGEHPHQAFEIMSFVVKGAIEHYDSHYREWRKLKEGDAQVIRSGSGISHSEKITPGSTMFQIWLDPDLDKAFQHPASYDDYASDKFPLEDTDGMKVKTYNGPGAPMQLETPGVVIKELWLKKGEHTLNLLKEGVHSIFLIEGTLTADEQPVQTNDFFVISEQDSVKLSVSEDARLFHIQTPATVPYTTYASRMV